jgi:hypothetical protein
MANAVVPPLPLFGQVAVVAAGPLATDAELGDLWFQITSLQNSQAITGITNAQIGEWLQYYMHVQSAGPAAGGAGKGSWCRPSLHSGRAPAAQAYVTVNNKRPTLERSMLTVKLIGRERYCRITD